MTELLALSSRKLPLPKRPEEEVALARELAFAIARARTVEEALEVALRKICETTGWALGQAWMLAAAGSFLECTPAWYAGSGGLEPFRKASEGRTFERGVGLPGRVWSAKKPVWIKDIRSDPGFPRSRVAAEVGLESGMAVPVLADDDVVAVMEFFVLEIREEDKRLLDLVWVVAAELGLLIQRKQAEWTLRASEARFRAVAESAKDAIVSANSDGHIIYLNPGAEHLFGYSAREVLGKPLTLLMPDRFHDDHQKGMKRFLSSGEARVIGRTVELAGKRKDGDEFPLELSLATWRVDEERLFTAILRDITERKRAEEKFRGLLEAAPDAMVIVDKGEIVLLNKQTEQLFGYTRNELITQPVEVLIPDRYRDHHPERRAAFIADPHPRLMGKDFELWALRSDGSEFPVEISLSPLKTNDGVLVIAAIRDVTERKRAEKALKESDLLKTTLLRTASHDFRSPLTAIKAAGEVSALPSLDLERRQELSSIIVGEASRLSGLVDKLLDLSRLEGGAAAPSRVSLSLEELIVSALEQVAGDSDAFALAIDSELPEVWGDPVQLERAFANLFENASRFGDPHPVEVRAHADNGSVVVRVVDRGPGILESEHERIFEPFYRGAVGAGREVGSGLGLAIVKGFIEANGGRVFVESLPRKQGATFVVELPLDSDSLAGLPPTRL